MLISKYGGIEIEEEIEKLESKYNITLPEDYKRFLVKYNGGDTPKTRLKVRKPRTDIRYFNGFNLKKKVANFSFVLNIDLGERLIKKNLLPIACNDWGDYIVLRVSEERNGEISFVYHDRPIKEIFISSTFTEFIEKCKSEKIGHISTIAERRQRMIANGFGDRITPITIKCWQDEIDHYSSLHQEEVEL